MKRFKVTGPCIPEKDYMVDMSSRIKEYRQFIDENHYFTINCARQYGKTTTLLLLERELASNYTCISLSFENMSDLSFQNEGTFCRQFLQQVEEFLNFSPYVSEDEAWIHSWENPEVLNFSDLRKHITKCCHNRKVVLMIDEVDKISNNQIFVHFLGILRGLYVHREAYGVETFHSVILVGVYDIKNIKLKLINEGLYSPSETEEKLYNSPWNIAIDVDINMTFTKDDIALMLTEYEKDHHSGMNTVLIAGHIYRFTNGYPYLVSWLCRSIDESDEKPWTEAGIVSSVQRLLSIHPKPALFDDMIKNLEAYPDLNRYLYEILFVGKSYAYNNADTIPDMAIMLGYTQMVQDTTKIHNKIFELKMIEYYTSRQDRLDQKRSISGVFAEDVVLNNRFDMALCLSKFSLHYKEIFRESDVPFLENYGRLIFITYLKPLLNGRGFFHIESAFTDQRRMDLVVDFGPDQFIIELKIQHGDVQHRKAYEQLALYLKAKGVKEGYLLTFDFRKKKKEPVSTQWIDYDGYRIYDVYASFMDS